MDKKSKDIINLHECINKANSEIQQVLKKYGLTLRVVHSIELIPTLKKGDKK